MVSTIVGSLVWWSQLTLGKDQGTKNIHFRVHQSAPSAVCDRPSIEGLGSLERLKVLELNNNLYFATSVIVYVEPCTQHPQF